MTVTVQIGNSDDRLTQAGWSEFYNAVSNTIHNYADTVWFSGTSDSREVWQNAAFVFDIETDTEECDSLKEELYTIAKRFKQRWTAWTEGGTQHI